MKDGSFNVMGVEITPEQRAAALEVMKKPFVAMQVAGALLRAGVPQETTDEYYRRNAASAPYVPARAADRILQAERKAGRVRFIKGQWHPVVDGKTVQGKVGKVARA